MRKVLYSKYNHSRAPKYQTKTVIYCENDRKYIEKTPANELAEGHIAGFKDSYDKVKSLYPNISVIDTEFGENYVRYPYLNGISLDEYISNQKMNFDEMFGRLFASSKTSKPSIPVRTTSMTTTSTELFSIVSKTSCPSLDTPTISNLSDFEK